MFKILALWAVPRSTSTAFEWMMRQRGDMECLHEPFGEAWYHGEEPLSPRTDENTVRNPGLSLESVYTKLKALATEQPVFIKDFPAYIDHMWYDDFLACFNHSFLIRDPAKTIESLYGRWPDVHFKEMGFQEQRQLFDILCDKYGAPPPVFDSDDLLENPPTMIERYCNAVDIPFMPEALSWEPGERDEVSWWDGGSFHDNLRNSDGFKAQPRRYAQLDKLPKRARELYEMALPHYQHLYRHRITAD